MAIGAAVDHGHCENWDRFSLSNQRFLALDGMRGLAAISVMVFHRKPWLEPPWLLDHAYLAVDFFFILSGFVLAHAYSERLRLGMTVKNFMLRRLIRLYPLAVVGVLMGMLMAFGFYLQGQGEKFVNLPAAAVFSLLLLPTFWEEAFFDSTYWPFNTPLWSIFFEMIASVFFALFAVRLILSRLVFLVIVLGILLVLSVWHAGSLELGQSPITFWFGFLRVGFAFALGLLLQQLYNRGVGANWRAGWLAPLVLVATFLIPKSASMGGLYDIVVVFILYPLIVLSSAHVEPLFPRLARLSGDLSYPVYVLHMPLLHGVAAILALAGLSGEPDLLGMIFRFCAVILLSWLALKIFDEPVRKALAPLASVRAN